MLRTEKNKKVYVVCVRVVGSISFVCGCSVEKCVKVLRNMQFSDIVGKCFDYARNKICKILCKIFNTS